MKKLLALLVALVVFIPGAVSAATDVYLAQPCGAVLYGPNESYTCTMRVSTTENVSAFEMDVIAPAKTTITVTPQGAWTGAYTNGTVKLTASTAQTGDFAVYTFTLKTNADWDVNTDDCIPEFGPPTVDTEIVPPPEIDNKYCEIDNGKYYGKDGSEVTETEYNNQCGCRVDDGKYYGPNGEEVTDTEYANLCDTKNPPTGAFAPYIIIGGCAVLAIGAYIVAKNRNKFYKI